ncbi:hypothetical protein [Phaeobacter piscinae]|uniref:hypothetical protein n=1 Tax=Phaeobacter piscinae TaxID=1580596 RepID=UPI000CA16709|nr:hypothetical protein [Phaeobacter piscinae]AUQ75745.1 hypothetical protein PhaeoP71_02904 [Phaeobacter piscinae]
MDKRLNRAKQAAGRSNRTPSQKIIGAKTFAGAILLLFSAATVLLAVDALRVQNSYVNRIEKTPLVDSWSYVLRGSRVGSDLIKRNYLDKRPEPAEVAVIKAAMPSVFDGFYFSNVRDMGRFADDFLGDGAKFELLTHRLQYGLVINRFFCKSPDDLSSCYHDAAGQRLTPRETDVLVSFLSGDFDDLFFSKLEREGFASVRPIVEQIGPLIINGDFEFFTAGSAPQLLSKWLIIVGIFQAMGDEDAPSLEEDLALLYFSPVSRSIEKRMKNPALKLYRGAIENYYAGCFDETIRRMQRFRSLTSNELLTETSIIFEGRAVIRPLFRNYFFTEPPTSDRIESLDALTYCGQTFSQAVLLERADSFFSQSIEFDREHYVDDFHSLKSFFEGYHEEFSRRVSEPPVAVTDLP